MSISVGADWDMTIRDRAQIELRPCPRSLRGPHAWRRCRLQGRPETSAMRWHRHRLHLTRTPTARLARTARRAYPAIPVPSYPRKVTSASYTSHFVPSILLCEDSPPDRGYDRLIDCPVAIKLF